jgi:glycosyltransferase involved in cell wall biosynthesis|tara:strand:- start:4 stop:1083 length:1080 start_codon:yes stop_codon:yes gene_type:complete
MKKILFVIPLPPPVHGASVINDIIRKNIKINKNFKTYFFNSSPVKKIEDIGKFKIKKMIKFIYSYFVLFIKILKINPHFIYFNPSPRGIGLYRDILFIALYKILNKKLIFHLHGRGFYESVKNSFLLKKILIICFKNVNLICLSNLLIKDVNLIRDKTKQVFILHNFSKKNNSNSKKNKYFTFIYLSNLISSKGVLTFVGAIKILNKKYKNFNATVVGNKRDQIFFKKFKNKIKMLHNVKYLGPLFGKKKNDVIKKSNVLVFPTQYPNETFSLVLLEAMSAGLPIISSNIGGLPDIIDHNKNGFIVTSNNSSQYAKYMEFFLKKKKLSKQFGINAKKKFNKKFSLNIFENNLIKILNQI